MITQAGQMELFNMIRSNAPQPLDSIGNTFDNVDINKKVTQTTDFSNTYGLTFTNEVLNGVSNKIHHPTGKVTDKSGVTLGPGYDMRHKSPEQIKKDLIAIGVSKDKANLLSSASGLTGQKALDFVKNNRKAIELSELQEKQLFNLLAPKYEEAAKKQYGLLTKTKNKPKYDELPDEVKTLLFDYAYNVGVTEFPTFFEGVLTGDKQKALDNYKRYSSGKPLGRRNKDTLDFLYKYNFRDLTVRR